MYLKTHNGKLMYFLPNTKRCSPTKYFQHFIFTLLSRAQTHVVPSAAQECASALRLGLASEWPCSVSDHGLENRSTISRKFRLRLVTVRLQFCQHWNFKYKSRHMPHSQCSALLVSQLVMGYVQQVTGC